VAGAFVGLLVALVFGRLLGHSLVETSPHDGVALIGAAALMMMVSVAASLIPAQKAATGDTAKRFGRTESARVRMRICTGVRTY